MKTKSKMDASKAIDILSQMKKTFESFEDENGNLKVERHLKLSILFSIIAIIVSLITISTSNTNIFQTGYTLTSLSISLITVSIYYMLRILFAWHTIYELMN